MKRRDWAIWALAPLLPGALAAQAQANPTLPVPKGRRLREIVADKYQGQKVYVGGTTGWNKRPGGSGVTLEREFSYVTPENDFKQGVINPWPGKWDWTLPDNWVERCRETKQLIRMHGPISPQCSRWAKDDERTPEELERTLVDFMTRLCQRYDKHPHVKWMDVVNETVLANGRWHGPKPGQMEWENPWPKIGYDERGAFRPPIYIKKAFEICTKHAPNTALIINQHGDMEQPMWDKIRQLVPYLRDRALRVDGIGWQAHIDVGWENNADNMSRLHELIEWCHRRELSFHVTEKNVWLRDDPKDYEAQARTFEAVMRALLEHRGAGEIGWNVWNLSDGDAWKEMEKFDGCLFDRKYRPKPAYYALQRVLENPPPAR